MTMQVKRTKEEVDALRSALRPATTAVAAKQAAAKQSAASTSQAATSHKTDKGA